MKRVRLLLNRSVRWNGKTFTPSSGAFELPDEVVENFLRASPSLLAVETDAVEPEEPPVVEYVEHELYQLASVDAKLFDALVASGFGSIEALAKATPDDLKVLKKGVTKARALKLIAEAREFWNEEG